MLRMYHAGCAWSTTKWASKDRKPRHRGIFSTVTRLWKCGCEWLWKVSHVEYILELLGQDTSLFLAFDAEFHCTKNQHSSPLQIFCCNFFFCFFFTFCNTKQYFFQSWLVVSEFVAPFFQEPAKLRFCMAPRREKGASCTSFRCQDQWDTCGHGWILSAVTYGCFRK